MYRSVLASVGAQEIIPFFDSHFALSPAVSSGTSDSEELSEAELEPACWGISHSRSETELLSSSAEEERDTEVEEEDPVAVWAGHCRVAGVLEGPGRVRLEVRAVRRPERPR